MSLDDAEFLADELPDEVAYGNTQTNLEKWLDLVPQQPPSLWTPMLDPDCDRPSISDPMLLLYIQELSCKLFCSIHFLWQGRNFFPMPWMGN